jgi:chromosome segregation ATPase
MGGTRAKNMIGNIGQREEELSTRGAELYDVEQRLATAQADLNERTNALNSREKHMQQREQALLERRNALSTHDQTNHEREQAFAMFEEGMLRQLESNYNSIASTVSQMRRAVGNAQGILINRRQQVLYHENFSNAMQDTHGQGNHEHLSTSGGIVRSHIETGRYGGSIAIDGAIGALGGLDHMLAQSEIALLGQIHNAIRRQHPC